MAATSKQARGWSFSAELDISTRLHAQLESIAIENRIVPNRSPPPNSLPRRRNGHGHVSGLSIVNSRLGESCKAHSASGMGFLSHISGAGGPPRRNAPAEFGFRVPFELGC